MSQERPRHRAMLAGSSRLADASGHLVTQLRTVAFWLAVLLPLAYPPAFLSSDGGVEGLLLVAALLVAHVAALAMGHGHRPGVT